MSKKGDKYEWIVGHPPPPIDPHSLVKHKIIGRYLESYIKVLMGNPRRECLKISVVDGFAGGGEYLSDDGKEIHEGSPLIALRSVMETEIYLNEGGKKEKTVDAKFYFIEKKPSTFKYLSKLLGSDYQNRFEKDIFLFKSPFNEVLPQIIQQISNHKGGERAIFLLDQYAYDDIPMQILKIIFSSLKNAEVLLTFNVDSLITFLSDTPQFKIILEALGLLQHVDLKYYSYLKESNDPNWKAVIQRMLARGIMIESGARFSTIFYITPLGQTPWTYWLVHLSNEFKARDVMMELHWEQSNHFSHYLEPDIFTLGYNASRDSNATKQASFEEICEDFSFDALAAKKCQTGLSEKLARKIYDDDKPVKVISLLEEIVSFTPATKKMICESLTLPINAGDIEVFSEENTKREKGSSIHIKDTIVPSRQKRIFLPYK